MSDEISDLQLAEYDARGLIPGPEESESDFVRRATYCLSLRETLREKALSDLPSGTFEDTQGLLKEGREVVKKNYAIDPDWVPLALTKQQLAPWHGGSTWIFQVDDASPIGALLQLRPNPWWISHQEVAAHELCHIGRMAFEEPEYEEILAYYLSTSPLRKWCGAIIQTRMESFWFVISLLSVLFFDLAALMWGNYHLFFFVQWMKLLPLGLAGWGIFRLAKRLKKFSNALKNMEGVTTHPLAMAYRLTDREINMFARMKKEEILEYVREQDSLRWRAIRENIH
jgi:hypothetical protein